MTPETRKRLEKDLRFGLWMLAGGLIIFNTAIGVIAGAWWGTLALGVEVSIMGLAHIGLTFTEALIATLKEGESK